MRFMANKKKYDDRIHQIRLDSTISAIGEKTEYFDTGCGTFLRDWTWLDPREIDPALVDIFTSHIEQLHTKNWK